MTSPVSRMARQISSISTLVDPERILRASNLPAGIVERLQASQSRVRVRFTMHLCSKLGLSPLDETASRVPTDQGSVLTCAAWVGLALAMAKHDGVFFRNEYALLLQTHGEQALSFALQNRSKLTNLDSEAALSMDRDTLVRIGGVWLAAWAEAEQPALETWIIAALPPFETVKLPDIGRLSKAAFMIRAAVQACWSEDSQT